MSNKQQSNLTQKNNWITLAGKVTARESTLGSRTPSKKEFETPAPGEYDIDRLDKSKLQSGGCMRGYTFGHPNIHSRPSRLPGNQFAQMQRMEKTGSLSLTQSIWMNSQRTFMKSASTQTRLYQYFCYLNSITSHFQHFWCIM